MKNWTDKIINWNQLPATEVRRLLDTWGMTDRQIANYDSKRGFKTTPKPAEQVVAKKPQTKTVTVTVKRADLKKPTQAKATTSKADVVRDMIAQGLSETQVINQCVNELGMSVGLAKTYYKNNLSKVAVGA